MLREPRSKYFPIIIQHTNFLQWGTRILIINTLFVQSLSILSGMSCIADILLQPLKKASVLLQNLQGDILCAAGEFCCRYPDIQAAAAPSIL